MNEKNRNILNLDPIETAENIISKRHEEWDKESEEKLALNLSIKANQIKDECF